MTRIDFEVSGGGTVYLLHPLTRAARTWVAENLPADATWWCGRGRRRAPLHRANHRRRHR